MRFQFAVVAWLAAHSTVCAIGIFGDFPGSVAVDNEGASTDAAASLDSVAESAESTRGRSGLRRENKTAVVAATTKNTKKGTKGSKAKAAKSMASPSVSPTSRYLFATKTQLQDAMEEYFIQGCPNGPDCQATSVYGGAIGNWDVSRLTDFSYLFYVCDSIVTNTLSGAGAFNEPINWNTESATNMEGMFHVAKAFNQPLSFDTAKVTNMVIMFDSATAFNQPLSFDTAKVIDIQGMFYRATSFNQAVSFDTANVTKMDYMFSGATAFNQPLSFDTAKVTDMREMFLDATAFNQDLCHFGVNFSQKTVTRMFEDSGCSDKDEPVSATGPWCAVTACTE